MTSSNNSGADLMVEVLRNFGVDTIFCITGAGNLAIVDAIVRDGSIKLVYSHHEQAAVIEAQGYSRISSKLGVALVTTGGGTSNAMTGVLSAYLDSIPILVISGNESSFHCENLFGLRAYGVQGFDSVSVALPITKHASRIEALDCLESQIKFSIHQATTDRMGSVLLDFPMDLQRRSCVNLERSIYQPLGFISSNNNERVDRHNPSMNKLVAEFSIAERPILYIGNGCRSPQVIELLTELIKRYRLPFALSWSAIDLLPELLEFNIGRIGIYGDRAANILLQKADLILTIGTRLAIPQTGYEKRDFGRKATKWIVDVDKTELEKFQNLEWNLVHSPSLEFTSSLYQGLMNADMGPLMTNMSAWWLEIERVVNQTPRIEQVGQVDFGPRMIHSAKVMEYLNHNLADNAVIVTDVGAGLLSGHYMLEPKMNQRVFTSQGLGEMGFGLPGAIGAFFAEPERQLVCLNTDGAIMFNLQELQVVREHKIPLKLFIFNNNGYSMIRISQDNLFNSRLAGSTKETGISFPSFQELAKTFGFDYISVKALLDLESLMPKMVDDSLVLIEVIMSPDQKYLPRLSTAKLEDGSLVSPPLEDLDPLIEIENLENLLGYTPHEMSYRVREKNHGR
jgi:acetolactate synthase-1/2/3 large subunit